MSATDNSQSKNRDLAVRTSRTFLHNSHKLGIIVLALPAAFASCCQFSFAFRRSLTDGQTPVRRPSTVCRRTAASAVHPPIDDGRGIRQTAHSDPRLSADHGFRDYWQLRTFYAAGWHYQRQYNKLRYEMGRSELKEM